MIAARAQVPPARAQGGDAWRDSLRTLAAVFVGALLVFGVQWTGAGTGADRGAVGNLRQIAKGKLCAVLLVNGQIYYGIMADAGPDFVRLSNVYYVRGTASGTGGGAQSELVNRKKTDFHAPDWMEVPVEKILFIEKVGDDSTVAHLIDRDQQAPGRQASVPQ